MHTRLQYKLFNQKRQINFIVILKYLKYVIFFFFLCTQSVDVSHHLMMSGSAVICWLPAAACNKPLHMHRLATLRSSAPSAEPSSSLLCTPHRLGSMRHRLGPTSTIILLRLSHTSQTLIRQIHHFWRIKVPPGGRHRPRHLSLAPLITANPLRRLTKVERLERTCPCRFPTTQVVYYFMYMDYERVAKMEFCFI